MAFVYRQNFRAQELRQHATPNSWRFGAADDAAAAAIAATMASYSGAQQTSLTKNLGLVGNDIAVPPLGTRITVALFIRDVGGGVQRINARNVALTTSPADFDKLFRGIAGGNVPTALSAPAQLVGFGSDVISVSPAFRTLLA